MQLIKKIILGKIILILFSPSFAAGNQTSTVTVLESSTWTSGATYVRVKELLKNPAKCGGNNAKPTMFVIQENMKDTTDSKNEGYEMMRAHLLTGAINGKTLKVVIWGGGCAGAYPMAINLGIIY